MLKKLFDNFVELIIGHEENIPITAAAWLTISLVFFTVLNLLIQKWQLFDRLQVMDDSLFLVINRHHTPFWNLVMQQVSNPRVWAPFYVMILAILIKGHGKHAIHICFFAGMLGLLNILVVNDGIKPVVKGDAPGCVQALAGFLHQPPMTDGCTYSFFSLQATTAFGLAIFLSLLLPARYRLLKTVLFLWVGLVAYSRIYNGLHFPGDVAGAILLSALLAYPAYQLYVHYIGPLWELPHY